MAKQQKTIRDWVAGVFGTSYKSISEKLSAEEHEEFIQAADNLRQSQDKGDDDEDEDSEEDEEETDDTKDEADDKEAKNDDLTKTKAVSIEDRLAKLEQSLATKTKENKSLKTKLSQAESKLEKSTETNTKLRQSVNPLGEEDAAQGEQADKFLTKTDIEAREARKASQES